MEDPSYVGDQPEEEEMETGKITRWMSVYSYLAHNMRQEHDRSTT